jgi:hypothetical protein
MNKDYPLGQLLDIFFLEQKKLDLKKGLAYQNSICKSLY